jgi:hypothetical protein
MPPRRLLILAILAGLSAGCRREEYQTALVSGRVTLDGQPVARVAVMFQPVAPPGNINPGPGSYGITDAQGRYTLRLMGKETPGAVVGKHKVRIENYTEPDLPSATAGGLPDDRPKRSKPPGLPIPLKYNAITPLLEYDVPAAGTDSANFELTSS